MKHNVIFAALFAMLAMTTTLAVFTNHVQASPTLTTFILDNITYDRWHTTGRTQVVVVLYGGAMLDYRCPYTYNVWTKTYHSLLTSDNERGWVTELNNYGFDVVAIETGSDSSIPTMQCYSKEMSWVRNLINYLHGTYGYSKVSLFGHSAGGIIVAYEIEQRTNINGAVFVSAPVNHYSDPLFQSAQNARNIKTNVRLQWGTSDPYNLDPEMTLYYNNAQSSGHTVQRDYITGNMHDNYFNPTSPWTTYRNNAKSFLWNYS